MLTLCPFVAEGQATAIPGRDLLAFPIGQTAETSALASMSGTGLWNPAVIELPDSARWRLAAAAMNAPVDVAVSAQVLSVAFGRWRGTTFSASLVNASVGSLTRTDNNPESVGGDVTYATSVLSLMAARRVRRWLVVGLAVRERSGRLDRDARSGLAFDGGVIADHLTRADLRVGLSTFLLHAGGNARERASYFGAADARLAGADSARTVRAGYGIEQTDGLSTEHVFYASARYRALEVRGGPVRTTIYGASNWRLRVGLAVHYAGYLVGVAREETAGGLAPVYQFSLSSLLR